MRILLQKLERTIRRSAINDPVLKVRIVLRQNTFDRGTNEFFSVERRGDDRNLHTKPEAGAEFKICGIIAYCRRKAGKSNEIPMPPSPRRRNHFERSRKHLKTYR